MAVTKKKYYWYSYVYNNAGDGKTYSEQTCSVHPFEEMRRLDKIAGTGNVAHLTLLNWKEISSKENDLFHE